MHESLAAWLLCLSTIYGNIANFRDKFNNNEFKNHHYLIHTVGIWLVYYLLSIYKAVSLQMASFVNSNQAFTCLLMKFAFC